MALEEQRVIDIKFLHGCAKPTLSILYIDARKQRHVKTCCVDIREKELSPGPWPQMSVEFGAHLLIPVSSPLGGVLVVGSTTVSYCHMSGNVQSIEMQPAQVTAYEQLDADGTRFLMSDSTGRLLVVVLAACRIAEGQNKGQMKVENIKIDYVGTTSVAESLTYLDNGIVFVGSVYGDSQLIQLKPTKDADGSNIELLDTYINIGPITDMCLVDNDKHGGQRQLVTCSGAYKDGSLRVIRSGIGLEEQASLEVPGIKVRSRHLEGVADCNRSFEAPRCMHAFASQF